MPWMKGDGMRGLSEQFLKDLKKGILEPLRQAVITDKDVVLAIRQNAINLYYKGNNLLGLTCKSDGYDVSVNAKFRIPAISRLKRLQTAKDVAVFMKALPYVKQKILTLHKGGSEIEYEQMIIRANNLEPRLLTDYLIIDRQLVTADRKGRFDLTGIHLTKGSWHRSKTASLALLEIKFGLNKDIAEIHEQLDGYYQSVADHLKEIAEESETILRRVIGDSH